MGPAKLSNFMAGDMGSRRAGQERTGAGTGIVIQYRVTRIPCSGLVLMPQIRLFAALAIAASTLSACGVQPQSWGEWNSIIVATSEDEWNIIGEMVETTLEARVLTVRAEKTFRVTHQVPVGLEWGRLRRFRQLLLIGTAEDPWMSEALRLSGRDSFDPPEIFQVEEVWARDQLATVLLLSRTGGEEAAGLMEPLHELLDGQYRTWVRARMYMTGRNTVLADSLWARAQFTLMLPDLYRQKTEDSVFMFRNDNPDPTELIRQITVTWRTSVQDDMSDEDILAWRQEVSDVHFSYPQVHDLDLAESRRLQIGDLVLDEIRAVWATPPEDLFPAGGPFIVRAIPCPEQGRHYLVDAWLYAPSRDKYQYVLQLENILNTFTCSAPV